MYQKLTKYEANSYYSKYYPKILEFWQKNGHEPRPLILKRLGIKNKQILDIGCGNGLMLKDLVRENKVYGLDISPKLVTQAKRYGIKAQVGDIESKKEIRLPKGSFDILLLFEVFEHLFDSENLIRMSAIFLKDNGIIYMTLPNKTYPKREELIQYSLGSALKHIYGTRIPQSAKRFPDINIQKIPFIKKLLKKYGLKLEKVYGWSWSWEDLSIAEREKLWRTHLKAPDLLLKIKKDNSAT